jgi:hypothetical protein
MGMNALQLTLFLKFQNNLVTSWLLIFLHQIDFMFSLFHIFFFFSPWFYLCIKRKTKNQMETWNSKINVSTFFLFSNAYLIIIVYRLFFIIFYLLLTFPFWCLPLLPICPFSYDVLVPPFWSEYIYWISQLEKKDKMVENFISNTVDSWYPI